MCNEWDLAHHGRKPDIVTLGKCLSGGVSPVSGIMANDEVMGVLDEDDFASTYGGNPLGMAIAKTCMEILTEEGLVDNSLEVGEYFRSKLQAMKSPLIRNVRGRGLMNCLEIERNSNVTGHTMCDIMKDYGVLTKATKDYSIRFTPALVINKKEIDEVCEIIEQSLRDLEKKNDSL